MSKRSKQSSPAEAATHAMAAGQGASQSLPLDHGRAVLVLDDEGTRNVEIRDAGGGLMLRVRMTPEGPVVQLEAARLELVAKHDVAVRCERFEVDASQSAVIKSQGALHLESAEPLTVHSDGDVKVSAATIWLN
jgi:hypothetical protein